MGNSESHLSAQVAVNIQTHQKETCSVENVCQVASVGDVSFKGSNLDCGTIDIAGNQSSSAFTCDSNQSAVSTANVAQKLLASATASWGDFSSSDVHANVGIGITNDMQQNCGGQNQHASAKTGGIVPNGGACHTGIVQESTIKSVQFIDDSVSCAVMDLGVNNANTSVQCTLGQASKADAQVSQKASSISKGTNELMMIIIAVFAVAMLLVIGPFIVGGLIKLVQDYEKEAAGTGREKSMTAQLKEEQQQLQEEELQGEAFAMKKKLLAEGMSASDIGFKHVAPPAVGRTMAVRPRRGAVPPQRRGVTFAPSPLRR